MPRLIRPKWENQDEASYCRLKLRKNPRNESQRGKEKSHVEDPWAGESVEGFRLWCVAPSEEAGKLSGLAGGKKVDVRATPKATKTIENRRKKVNVWKTEKTGRKVGVEILRRGNVDRQKRHNEIVSQLENP